MPSGLPITDPDNLKIAREFCLLAQKNNVDGMDDFLHFHPGFNIATPYEKFTALHYACKYKALEAAIVLINLGGDLSEANKDGVKPIDLCASDSTFSKKLLEEQGEDNILSKASFYTGRERSNRVQLGNLGYKTEIRYTSDVIEQIKSEDEKNDLSAEQNTVRMLYFITGSSFQIFTRKLPSQETIFDAVFDAESSGGIHIMLCSAKLPHEYVNSKYLIVTDFLNPNNINKLTAFYKNPINRYSADEILCDNSRRDDWDRARENSHNTGGALIMPLGFPEPILKKYFKVNPEGSSSYYGEKEDAESALFFARRKHKTNLAFVPGLNLLGELLAKEARDSLYKSFPASRPNPKMIVIPDTKEKVEASNTMKPIVHSFEFSKDRETLKKRNVTDLNLLIAILKQYKLKKDGENLPTPELVLRRAAATGKIETIKMLNKLVEDLNFEEKGVESGKTALDLAIQYDKTEVIKYLREVKDLPPLVTPITIGSSASL